MTMSSIEKSGVSGPGLSANSVYLCVLCVKYVGANDLTQSTQRYAEIRRESTAEIKRGVSGLFVQKLLELVH
jgi:hypothetical protein